MAEKKMNKKELIEVLVNEYGYDKEDLKDKDGKLLTNAQLEAILKKEKEDAKRIKEQDETVEFARQLFRDDDLIAVMNGVSGHLVHRSPETGRVWTFKEFGVINKLPYSEIVRIRNNSPKVFDEGWLIILNKQIQEDFGLVEATKKFLTPKNIDSVFDKPIEELNAYLDSLPKNMKVTFVSRARQLYEEGKLDSRRLIDFIEKKFDISFDDNAPLSDVIVKE